MDEMGARALMERMSVTEPPPSLVDIPLARQELEAALADLPSGGDDPAEAKYARARLRVAGEQI